MPILEGCLRHFPAGELLEMLAAHGHSGVLEAEHRGHKARVWLQEGSVMWATSNDETFDLPSLLSTYGLLTKEQFDHLRNGGEVSEEQRSFHVSEIIFDLCTWISGKFAFDEKDDLPKGAIALNIETDRLIEQGTKRREEAMRVARLYDDESIRFQVVDDPASGSISLTGEQFRILMRLGAGKTLGEVREEMGRTEADLYPVVKYLEEHGLILPIVPLVETKTAEVVKPKVPLPSTSDKEAISRRTLVGSMTGDGPGAPCYPLLEDDYSIGREASNKISLSDGSVSARHARVYRTPEGFVIEDLKSRNGTYVNGEPVKERRLLADNDLVRIGKVILTFNLAKEQRAADKTEPGKQ